MARCPRCATQIGLATIAFAAYPVWISCPSCRAALVGNRFVKIQGIVVVISAGAIALLVVWAARAELLSGQSLAAGALDAVVAIPNIFTRIGMRVRGSNGHS